MLGAGRPTLQGEPHVLDAEPEVLAGRAREHKEREQLGDRVRILRIEQVARHHARADDGTLLYQPGRPGLGQLLDRGDALLERPQEGVAVVAQVVAAGAQQRPGAGLGHAAGRDPVLGAVRELKHDRVDRHGSGQGNEHLERLRPGHGCQLEFDQVAQALGRQAAVRELADLYVGGPGAERLVRAQEVRRSARPVLGPETGDCPGDQRQPAVHARQDPQVAQLSVEDLGHLGVVGLSGHGVVHARPGKLGQVDAGALEQARDQRGLSAHLLRGPGRRGLFGVLGGLLLLGRQRSPGRDGRFPLQYGEKERVDLVLLEPGDPGQLTLDELVRDLWYQLGEIPERIYPSNQGGAVLGGQRLELGYGGVLGFGDRLAAPLLFQLGGQATAAFRSQGGADRALLDAFDRDVCIRLGLALRQQLFRGGLGGWGGLGFGRRSERLGRRLCAFRRGLVGRLGGRALFRGRLHFGRNEVLRQVGQLVDRAKVFFRRGRRLGNDWERRGLCRWLSGGNGGHANLRLFKRVYVHQHLVPGPRRHPGRIFGDGGKNLFNLRPRPVFGDNGGLHLGQQLRVHVGLDELFYIAEPATGYLGGIFLPDPVDSRPGTREQTRISPQQILGRQHDPETAGEKVVGRHDIGESLAPRTLCGLAVGLWFHLGLVLGGFLVGGLLGLLRVGFRYELPGAGQLLFLGQRLRRDGGGLPGGLGLARLGLRGSAGALVPERIEELLRGNPLQLDLRVLGRNAAVLAQGLEPGGQRQESDLVELAPTEDVAGGELADGFDDVVDPVGHEIRDLVEVGERVVGRFLLLGRGGIALGNLLQVGPRGGEPLGQGRDRARHVGAQRLGGHLALVVDGRPPERGLQEVLREMVALGPGGAVRVEQDAAGPGGGAGGVRKNLLAVLVRPDADSLHVEQVEAADAAELLLQRVAFLAVLGHEPRDVPGLDQMATHGGERSLHPVVLREADAQGRVVDEVGLQGLGGNQAARGFDRDSVDGARHDLVLSRPGLRIVLGALDGEPGPTLALYQGVAVPGHAAGLLQVAHGPVGSDDLVDRAEVGRTRQERGGLDLLFRRHRRAALDQAAQPPFERSVVLFRGARVGLHVQVHDAPGPLGVGQRFVAASPRFGGRLVVLFLLVQVEGLVDMDVLLDGHRPALRGGERRELRHRLDRLQIGAGDVEGALLGVLELRAKGVLSGFVLGAHGAGQLQRVGQQGLSRRTESGRVAQAHDSVFAEIKQVRRGQRGQGRFVHVFGGFGLRNRSGVRSRRAVVLALRVLEEADDAGDARHVDGSDLGADPAGVGLDLIVGLFALVVLAPLVQVSGALAVADFADRHGHRVVVLDVGIGDDLAVDELHVEDVVERGIEIAAPTVGLLVVRLVLVHDVFDQRLQLLGRRLVELALFPQAAVLGQVGRVSQRLARLEPLVQVRGVSRQMRAADQDGRHRKSDQFDAELLGVGQGVLEGALDGVLVGIAFEPEQAPHPVARALLHHFAEDAVVADGREALHGLLVAKPMLLHVCGQPTRQGGNAGDAVGALLHRLADGVEEPDRLGADGPAQRLGPGNLGDAGPDRPAHGFRPVLDRRIGDGAPDGDGPVDVFAHYGTKCDVLVGAQRSGLLAGHGRGGELRDDLTDRRGDRGDAKIRQMGQRVDQGAAAAVLRQILGDGLAGLGRHLLRHEVLGALAGALGERGPDHAEGHLGHSFAGGLGGELDLQRGQERLDRKPDFRHESRHVDDDVSGLSQHRGVGFALLLRQEQIQVEDVLIRNGLAVLEILGRDGDLARVDRGDRGARERYVGQIGGQPFEEPCAPLLVARLDRLVILPTLERRGVLGHGTKPVRHRGFRGLLCDLRIPRKINFQRLVDVKLLQKQSPALPQSRGFQADLDRAGAAVGGREAQGARGRGELVPLGLDEFGRLLVADRGQHAVGGHDVDFGHGLHGDAAGGINAREVLGAHRAVPPVGRQKPELVHSPIPFLRWYRD